MSGAEQALATLRDYVERSTHWQEGGADRHDAKLALDELAEAADWTNKGLAEWRDQALTKTKHLVAVQATARIAVAHLQALMAQTALAGQTAVERAARDWLTSIDSEPQ